jgi:hypothetical protein
MIYLNIALACLLFVFIKVAQMAKWDLKEINAWGWLAMLLAPIVIGSTLCVVIIKWVWGDWNKTVF